MTSYKRDDRAFRLKIQARAAELRKIALTEKLARILARLRGEK